MTPQAPEPEPDRSADTQRFRRFVERRDEERPKAAGMPFRVITLLLGVAVFAGLVYLLFKL